MELEKIISDIVLPMVVAKDALMIKQMPGANPNEIIMLVIGESDDIARLIGRGGSVADSIREVVSIQGKIDGKRIKIKFESYNQEKEEL